MKLFFKYIYILTAFVMVCSSCLKYNLEDLPVYSDADIVDVKFDFRYKDLSDKWIDGEPIVKVVPLIVENKEINSESGTVSCTIKVPDANGSFTEEIRNSVSLTNLVGKFNLSTAALIKPLNGAPVLGTPGDFSKPCKYHVTAANGMGKDWVIEVLTLNK